MHNLQKASPLQRRQYILQELLVSLLCVSHGWKNEADKSGSSHVGMAFDFYNNVIIRTPESNSEEMKRTDIQERTKLGHTALPLSRL